MGCGASTDNGAKAQAPVAASAAEPKPVESAPTPAAEVTQPPPAPKDGASDWHVLVSKDDLSHATAGASVPGYYLAVHDNKDADAPRMSVVCLANGSVTPVRIKDKGRGLAGAKDLECLFMVDAAVAGKKQPLYCAMQSDGKAWMFKLSIKKKKWVVHGVKTFKVCPPPGEETATTNCEGARAYVEDGRLYMEYGNRGGRHEGRSVKPWVARIPLDIKAIRKGTFTVDPAALDVTYWPASIDNDPDVRQCADMGQAVGMARYGQLFAAAKDDEATETHFVSYIMERLPGAQAGGVENFKPLYRLQGAKIEAIYDITKDVSVFATDDEGKGSFLTVLHRHSGAAWKIRVVPPEGADPRLYGISGLSPADPSIRKEKDESSSESEQSSEEEEEAQEEQEERQEQEEQPDPMEAREEAMEARQAARQAADQEEAMEDRGEAREEAMEAREDAAEAQEDAMEAMEAQEQQQEE